MKYIVHFCVMATVFAGSVVFAFAAGGPPPEYINNLKSCTKSTFIKKEIGTYEYVIKGKLPNGRCDVQINHWTDYNDPEVKKLFGLSSPDDVKMMENRYEKGFWKCKLSQREVDELYAAYQKHDGENPLPQKLDNGGIKFSFDTNKMSSYDKLMLNYQMGPCVYYSGVKAWKSKNENFKRYACEYRDTTCYVLYGGSGTSSISSVSCTRGKASSDIQNKVLKHVKAGMCSEL